LYCIDECVKNDRLPSLGCGVLLMLFVSFGVSVCKMLGLS